MLAEKINVDMNTDEFFAEKTTVQDKNGNDVVILKRIPYAEKQELLTELAGSVLVADDETGVCYESSLYWLVLNYLFIKYYTNIDVDWVESIEDYQKLYDYCTSENLLNMYWDVAENSDIESMWGQYRDSIIRQYEARHSLAQMAKDLLNGGLDANLEETRALIEKLTDMRGAYLEKEEDKKVLQFAQKKPVPKVGGAKLNFAKKNK